MKRHHNIFILHAALLLFSVANIIAQSTTEDFQYLTTVSESMEAPLRLASDDQGFIYVADGNNQLVFKYDVAGSLVETIDVVEEPVSVAINGDDHLFIGDGATGYIYQYDQASGATAFYTESVYPSSMEFGPDNTLYVTDSRLQQVLVLDIAGNLIRTIGSGILDYPTGIALDTKNQQLFVGEHGGAGTGFSPTVRVYMFDLQGTLINSFGSHGSTDGRFYRIQGLTVGRCGNVYVVDPYQARISVFDPSGVFITKFGDFGLLDGQLNIPMDITVDNQERIVITSMNNGALELFSISDVLPSSNIRSGSAMICEGESTDIEVAFTGTAPWSFTYTIDGANPTVVNTSENPYTLTVSDGGHYEVIALSDASNPGTCFTGSADVIVNNTIPTSLVTGNDTICDGETAEISIALTGTTPWSFSYTLDGLNPVTVTTTSNPHIIEVSEPGLYELTDLMGGGCSGTGITGSANITVNPLPNATMTDGNVQVYIDPGETAELPVVLTGVPPWTITYTVDDLNPVSISDISEGSYTLISSATGTYEIKEVIDSICPSTVSFGYPEVVLSSAAPAPTSRIEEEDLFICPGEYIPIPVHFTGTAPWTFTYVVDDKTTTIIDNYDNPFLINAIYEGTYEVIELADLYGDGSDLSGSANVSYHALPVSNFSYVTENLELNLFSLSENADFFFWDFGDGFTSIEENPVHLYGSSGIYQVSLSTASEQCTGSTISRSITLTGTPVVDTTEPSIKIYPNPSGGMVTIELGNINSEALLEIVSLNGSIVYSELFPEGLSAKELDLGYLKPGVYFVKITTQDEIITEKLIISNKKY